MDFIFYDLILLGIFIIFSVVFLYKNRKKLEREGVLFLYRTQWGVRLIDKVGGKYKKTLKVLSYVSITLSYILMVAVLFLIINTVYVYLTSSISETIKAPPIMPLIPYFPQLFGLESMFPPFYFTYFIIAILIVATAHEFSHGIFARRYGVKIKSTGFAFLKYFPAFFGAFVEQDEKQMDKSKKFEQLSVLSAGVFANIIMCILFIILMALFFILAYSNQGIIFNMYQYNQINTQDINSVNGIEISNSTTQNILDLLNEEGINELEVKGNNFLITKDMLESQENSSEIIVYYDAPAVRSNLSSVISSINDIEIKSLEELDRELNKYSPGERVIIKSNLNDEKYNVTLGKNPRDETKPWLGIVFFKKDTSGLRGFIYKTVSFFKDEGVYYESDIGNLGIFIYNLLWWVILINFAVALFNMLPVGILDGGRFFYLTILRIFKKESIARKSYVTITYFILLLFLALMIRWTFTFF